MSFSAFLDNPNLFVVDQLKTDAVNFLNNATVTVSLFELGGTLVPGNTWPQTMQYIAGSDGRYEAIFPRTLDVERGMVANAIVDAGTIAPDTAHFECPILFKDRACLP